METGIVTNDDLPLNDFVVLAMARSINVREYKRNLKGQEQTCSAACPVVPQALHCGRPMLFNQLQPT